MPSRRSAATHRHVRLTAAAAAQRGRAGLHQFPRVQPGRYQVFRYRHQQDDLFPSETSATTPGLTFSRARSARSRRSFSGTWPRRAGENGGPAVGPAVAVLQHFFQHAGEGLRGMFFRLFLQLPLALQHLLQAGQDLTGIRFTRRETSSRVAESSFTFR